jgi:hypothetical protein
MDSSIEDPRRGAPMARGKAPLFAGIALVLFSSPPAMAQGSSEVLVIPLGGSVPGVSTERLDAALADAGRRAGARVEVAQVSRDDIFALAGCHSETPACLRRVRDTLDVDAVVVGSVEPTEGGARVTLLLAERNRPANRVTYDLSGDPKAMEAELADKATGLFAHGDPDDPSTTGDDPGATGDDPGAAGDDPGARAIVDDDSRPDGGRWNRPPYRFEAGEVEPWAWGLAGGGGGAIVLGLVFYSIAGSRQDAVDQAPSMTVEDLERLQRLERSGRRFTTLGNTFTLLGLGALATGTVFVLRQGLVREESPGLSVEPLALPGGGGISVTWRSR